MDGADQRLARTPPIATLAERLEFTERTVLEAMESSAGYPVTFLIVPSRGLLGRPAWYD